MAPERRVRNRPKLGQANDREVFSSYFPDRYLYSSYVITEGRYANQFGKRGPAPTMKNNFLVRNFTKTIWFHDISVSYLFYGVFVG